jgi:TetR/AcrR family transcriptional regulator, mexJK operon transcriptional repressor
METLTADRIAPSWERKQEAIGRAALRLFARDGYERTSVDAIAAEAGVSKRTVYSHYGDKESLFLAVVRDTFGQMRARFREVLAGISLEGGDAAQILSAGVREIAGSVMLRPERATLIRLFFAESPHFPALLEMWQDRGILPILTEHLSRLAASGLLRLDDPVLAAEHFSALTFGQLNTRTMMGAVQVSDAEIGRIITGGVRVFLCAYGR